MCGFLGGNNNKWNYKEGLQTIYHRGPDAQQVKYMQGFNMAFARLSIIDLSQNAMQPITSADGKVTLVYNGEIYGYSNLKKTLERKYRFISNSDSEVILNAYLEYGDAFVDKIDGMFAIAIYDKRMMQIKLFRDRVGIKPLYYYYDGVNFAIASELKALKKACISINFEIDYTAVYDYLFYQYIPEPKTLYKKCFKLPAAHKLIFDIQAHRIITIDKYWKLHVNSMKGRYRKESTLCEELRSLLYESVKDQLVADVPVGTFLSGGVDSSIISFISNELNPNIYTFTIGFQDKVYNEVPYAEILVQQYKLRNIKKILTDQDIRALGHKLKIWYDEPFADTSAYPSFVVSELASEKVKVVLTGDGGDELFGGYTRYKSYAEYMKGKWIDNQLFSDFGRKFDYFNINSDRIIQKIFSTGLESYSSTIFIANKKVTERYRKKWGIDKEYDITWHLKKYYKKELPVMTRARYLDFKTYLPGDILTKMDRVSMANSIETRVPFLSRKLIEFAFSLSEEECCSADELKRILKKSFEKEISNKILYRNKAGFTVPAKYLLDKKRHDLPVTIGVLLSDWNDVVNRI